MSSYDVIYEYAADNYGLITSSVAKTLGIPNVELVKLAHRGKLRRLGHGVYQIFHYTPTAYDKYALAVILVGTGAMIYGESVLAMHGLALLSPASIYVAAQNKVRKKLPSYLKIVYPEKFYDKVEYEGIPSQSVYEAFEVCRNTIMTERLVDSLEEAKRMGLITSAEATTMRAKLV